MSDDRQATIGRSATLSTPAEREILTERVFDSPRERVWTAFTDPAQLARWWGREANTTTIEQLDLRAGGAWRFVERNSDGTEHGFRGVYREVLAPERLVYTFEWEGLPGHVLVNTATFADLGERTRVSIHSLFHTTAERDGMLSAGMERGLNESYQVLDALLAELSADA
jgi:uncharacterized protein YndB with AHSA1/START domain